LAQLKGNFFTTTNGESGSFQRYQAAWSWYHGFKAPRLVLATNLLACGAPAGGAGLRFQLTRKYPMHLRLDYAWGRDGGLLYFSVGEAI
jgi:hypothetical protein